MAQIKKDTSLRKAILQAAIIGELTSNSPRDFASQNSQDELYYATGKQLLDRIIEERNKKLLAEWEETLKKNPKAKKLALVVASEIDEDEIPFEIPENWCWCRLGDLITFVGGYAFKSTDFNEVTNNQVIRLGNVKENSLILDQKQVFVSDLVAQQASSYQIKESDILVTMTGTRGKGDYFFTVHITDSVLNGKKLFINQRVGCLRTNSLISSKWLCFTLQSNFIREAIFEHETGTANQGNIGSEDIKKILLPLPPLEVQNVIVEKLEQVIPLVDTYENAVLQKEELKNALPDKVKKAILQEAITGKLTEAWRKTVKITEIGKQLLDRIISERNAKALAEWEEALKKNPKLKKPAPIIASEIEEDEIPFEIPDSWCWCRLGEVCTKLVDGDHNPPAGLPTKTEYIMASSQNINNDSLVDLEKVRYLSKEVFEVENERTKAEKGDIFFTSVGTLGRSCIFDGSKNICFQRSVSVLKTEIYNKFLKYCLDTPFIQFFVIDNATGTAQKGFYLNQLAKLVIPLPPLEEQEEIVKKVEELLPLCK